MLILWCCLVGLAVTAEGYRFCEDGGVTCYEVDPEKDRLCCEHIYRDPHCPNLSFFPRNWWNGRSAREVTRFIDDPVSNVKVRVAFTETEDCEGINECGEAVQGMQALDMSERGLNDISYNFVMSGGGRVFIGRGWDALGETPSLSLIGLIGRRIKMCPREQILDILKRAAVFLNCVVTTFRQIHPGKSFVLEVKKYSGQWTPLEVPVSKDILYDNLCFSSVTF